MEFILFMLHVCRWYGFRWGKQNDLDSEQYLQNYDYIMYITDLSGDG